MTKPRKPQTILEEVSGTLGEKLARYYLEDSKQDQGNIWIFCSRKMGTGILSS